MNRLPTALISALALLVLASAAAAQTYTTFSVPGATTTAPLKINARGDVAGYYMGQNGQLGLFVRSANGTVTPFTPPNSDYVTNFVDLNAGGTVVGTYADTNSLVHGFIRAANGATSVYDVPGAPFTILSGINESGVMIGAYLDSSATAAHAFVLERNGQFSPFDFPGALQTLPFAINNAGTVAGVAVFATDDGYSGYHGFVRSRNGAIDEILIPAANPSPILPPGVIESVSSVRPVAINPAGVVTGYYQWEQRDANNNQVAAGVRGWVRAANGTVTVFTEPNSDYAQPADINAAGTVIGTTRDATLQTQLGFVRDKKGTLELIALPGALATIPAAINEAGTATGTVVLPSGSDFSVLGFVLKR